MIKPVNKNITMKDIAKRAGVSVMSVSYALRNSDQVSESCREKILKVTAELNYQPNLPAQMLRGKKTGNIGLLICESPEEATASGYMAPIIVQFVKACEFENIRYSIEFVSNGATDNDFTVPPLLTGGIVDGVLVVGLSSNQQLHNYLENTSQLPWCSIGETAEYGVLTAIDKGIHSAIERLLALGHENIAFTYFEGYDFHNLAYKGFQNGAKEFNINMEDVRIGKFSSTTNDKERLSNSTVFLDNILNTSSPCSAVICTDMIQARGIVYAAMLKGIKIPDNLSIIAIGSSIDAEKAFPFISSIEIDFSEVMSQALTLMTRRINKKNIKQKMIEIEPKLCMRNSVSALRK